MTQLGDSKTNVRKYNLAKAYKAFLSYYKIKADIPKYKFKRPLPYVPPEAFLDQLIASANSYQLLAFMQTLKETGARPGEAFRLERKDIDTTNKTINISHPEKGCNLRILPISDKLIKMLQDLPHVKANFSLTTKTNMYAVKALGECLNVQSRSLVTMNCLKLILHFPLLVSNRRIRS
jgi:integrase